MPRFDFISGRPFREALELDYAELEKCMANKAWKSVHVLAGSIIEAVLIDYLIATPSNRENKKDPLKLDLAEAVALCRAENALSERSADLCTVVRSYRNLIHPGRIVRLGEAQPDRSSAQIAMALVDLIVADVASTRRDEFGLTAEQLISKIERDENCLPILRHLLEEAPAAERDRFFLDILPARYITLRGELTPISNSSEHDTVERIKRAYQIAKAAASETAQNSAAQQFIRVLREGDGLLVSWHEEAFFHVTDIARLTDAQAALVKQHLLAQFKIPISRDALDKVRGLEKFLEPGDVRAWIDPMVRALVTSTTQDSLKESIKTYLSAAKLATSVAVDKAIEVRLDEWISFFVERHEKDNEIVVADLKEDLTPDLPF